MEVLDIEVVHGDRLVQLLQLQARYNPRVAGDGLDAVSHGQVGFSDEKGIFSYFNKLKRYSVPLIVNSIRIGSRAALSMDSRAFGAFEERTFFKKLKFDRDDLIYVLMYWITGSLIFFIAYKFGLMGEIGFYLGKFG